jgi:hypothetical protein
MTGEIRLRSPERAAEGGKQSRLAPIEEARLADSTVVCSSQAVVSGYSDFP